jgi:ABC-type nitrate/sulfonate/bicarbonate transport system substrate-binding protein
MKSMNRSAFIVAGFAMALAASARAQAPAPKTIELSHFPGAIWQVLAAIDQGYFAKEGLAIHLDPVTGSVAQITGMMDGKYDLGLTALDNVIAYDAGQGEAPTQEKPDLVAFMGGEGGSLRVVGSPETKTIESLKGKTLAVDAKSTGFAFVLYKIAAMHGVTPKDYSLVAVGSSQARLDAILSGKAQAAVLNRPFDSLALSKGATDLGLMSKVFPHYQSSVGMARRAWAKAHRDELIGFIRAYVKGSLWIFEPRNKEAAIDLLVKNTPNLPRATAEDIYAATTGAGSVVSPVAALDPAGVKTVVALRSEYGVPKKKLDARKFYDLSYYKAATK